MNDLTHMNDALPCGCLRHRSRSFVHGLNEEEDESEEDDVDEDFNL